MRSGLRKKFNVLIATAIILLTLTTKFHVHSDAEHSNSTETTNICGTTICREFAESQKVAVHENAPEHDSSHDDQAPVSKGSCGGGHSCHCLYPLADSVKTTYPFVLRASLEPYKESRSSQGHLFGMFRPPRQV